MDVDFILIIKMKQGDDEAFNSFVRKYYDDIFRYCCYHCSDVKYAEDITQITFANFFEKLSDYRHRGKIKNYLFTIAGNLCKNYYKQKKPFYMDEELLDMESDALNIEESVADKVTLEWALNKLSYELREVIVLYYFQEMKLSEISSTLGISLPLVKYRLKKAKNILYDLLRKEDEIYESRRTDKKI